MFIHENAYENVVWKMAAILSRSQYVTWMSGYQFSNPSNSCQETCPIDLFVVVSIDPAFCVYFDLHHDQISIKRIT